MSVIVRPLRAIHQWTTLQGHHIAIFLHLGSPSAVTLTVNGKPVTLPANVSSKSVIRIVSGSDIRA